MRTLNEKFAELGQPRRIWAVGAINGDLDRLMTLHDHLAARFAVQDRIVYLGNYLGRTSPRNPEVMEELLAFRAALLAKPGMEPTDIVHLRGPAEESWQRLLRLQFAAQPTQTIEKLHEAGVESYLRLYDVSLNDTKTIARAGSTAITRWTNHLRDLQRRAAGHEPLMSSTRRAAFTQPADDAQQRLLFVPAGFDSTRTLEDQGEILWEGAQGNFSCAENGPYARIVRGFDPEQNGIQTEGRTITLDGGCGRGGPLACGCFDAQGNLTEIVAIGGMGALESLADGTMERMSDKAPAPRFLQQSLTPMPFKWNPQLAVSA